MRAAPISDDDMPDQEKCPINPSMPKAYCSHCKVPEGGMERNPRFSIRESRFRGNPIVEVLKNGGPIHMWDKHFRFGLRKAEMLLSCIELIREFGSSTDERRLAFQPRVVENQRRGLSIQISVEMYADFEHSSGERVDRPWLCLQALPPDTEHIGIGALKCQAICAVQDDLEAWLRKHRIAA
jgi:hypothetical protein